MAKRSVRRKRVHCLVIRTFGRGDACLATSDLPRDHGMTEGDARLLRDEPYLGRVVAFPNG